MHTGNVLDSAGYSERKSSSMRLTASVSYRKEYITYQQYCLGLPKTNLIASFTTLLLITLVIKGKVTAA